MTSPAIWRDTMLTAEAPPAPTPALFSPEGAAWKGFVAKNCTWFIGSRRKITFRGHAKAWLDNARKAGYPISKNPIKGATMVTAEGPYGHVSEVLWFTNEEVRVIEMNARGLGVISQRTFKRSDKRIRGFIL